MAGWKKEKGNEGDLFHLHFGEKRMQEYKEIEEGREGIFGDGSGIQIGALREFPV
jgi:hypothetical protein